MEGSCTCLLKGQHLRLESSFTAESLKTFKELCRPDCKSVFGREESRFASFLELTLCRCLPCNGCLNYSSQPFVVSLKVLQASLERVTATQDGLVILARVCIGETSSRTG